MHREAKSRLIWITLSLGLLAIISVILIFGIYRNNPRDPLSAVPQNARAVVLLRGAHIFGNTTSLDENIVKHLAGLPRFKNILDAVIFLDTICRMHPERFDGLRETNIAIAAVPVKEKIHALFIADAVTSLSEKKWRTLLQTWSRPIPAQGQAAGMTYEYNGIRFYVNFSNNLVLISSSQEAISLARETLNRPFKSDFLTQAVATAGSKVGATLFLPNELLEDWLLLPYPKIRSATYASSSSPGWSSLDVTLKEEDALLTGYISTQSENKSWLKWITGVPLAGTLPENFPFDALAFLHFSSILPVDGNNDKPSYTTDAIEELSVPSWSISFFLIPGSGAENTEVIIVRHPEFNTQTNDTTPSVNEIIATAGLPERLLELPTYYDPPYLIFATDSSIQPRIAYALRSGGKVSDAAWYRDFLSHLPDEAGVWGRLVLHRELPWSHQITGVVDDNMDIQSGSYSFEYTIRAGNEPFITMHLSRGTGFSGIKKNWAGPSTDASIVMSPAPVWDHVNKRYNLLVFDEDNKVYLFDPNGEKLWSRQIMGKVMGMPEEADLYKNSKVQYIFNTSSHIYALDLNGKDVEGFPIRLPSAATNPVAVIDYDNKKDYRFLLAVKGGKVLNYSKDGKKTKAWSEPKLPHDIHEKIAFLTIGGKDFIIIPDHEGEVLICDRKGASKLNIRRSFANASQTGFFMSGSGSEKRIITTDQSGNIQNIFPNNKTSTIKLDGFDINHRAVLGNFAGKQEPLMIILDQNWIRVYSFKGVKISEIPSPGLSLIDPVVINFHDATFFAVTNNETASIKLFELDKTHPVMEFSGEFKPSWMDIDQDGEPEMVTAKGQEILIHRIR